MDASGAPVLTPKDVAAPVVAHVLRGRSGSVFVPEHMRLASLFHGLPDWFSVGQRNGFASVTAAGA